jgi:hypothetical protein
MTTCKPHENKYKIKLVKKKGKGGRGMVFDATFNNISVIS